MYSLHQPAQHQLGKCTALALHAICYGLLSVACIAASMGAWLTETVVSRMLHEHGMLFVLGKAASLQM